MAKAESSVAKFRLKFYDDLKKNDSTELIRKSDMTKIILYKRYKSFDDPWTSCFYLNDKKSKRCVEYLNLLTSGKNLTNDGIAHLISNCGGITDGELNLCKAAMRREVRSRKLENLSTEPETLKKLFSQERKKFRESINRQKILNEQMNEDMDIFMSSIKDCLVALEPHSKISITSDTTIDVVKKNITKMLSLLEDFKDRADSIFVNIFEAMGKFARYETYDEKMDRDLFVFISRFFPNFLIPRKARARGNAID